MRRTIKQAMAVTALLAVASPAAAAWVVTFHLARHDHHSGGSAHHHGGGVGLEMVLHGHAHDEGTPAHEHPFLTSATLPMPAKRLLLVGAMPGDTPQVVVLLTFDRLLLASRGPAHDPPPRRESFSILRI